MRVQKTARGFRLVQHGVVLSEVRTSPGPTHSVFDVLAALVAVLKPDGKLGVLGFAGGAVVAPLRHLGVVQPIGTCDLDERSYGLFMENVGARLGSVCWEKADAVKWIENSNDTFDLLIDDLSIPLDDDVFKPDCSWTTLPGLMKLKLKPGGIVIANQLKPADRSWKNCMTVFEDNFDDVQVVHLDEFENRIVIASDGLRSVRSTARALRERLRDLGSRQAERMRVRSWPREQK